MNKKLRSLVISVAGVAVLLVLLLVGRVDAVAQGQEEGEEASESQAERIAVLAEDPAEAIELATTIPSDWTYDASDRTVYDEDAPLDYAIQMPEREWRQMLDSDEYYVLREKGTERAFSHPLNDNKERGIYYSKATGQPLFHSDDKYDSGTGWPSFTQPISPNAIVYVWDNSLWARRVETVDSLSGSHLGHVFSDGPGPTGQRYCMNGEALVFVPEGGDPPPIVGSAAAQ
ncbi:MAG: peptide-methionine (R)-S-oxide reductase MsrB [Spirochaetales bacterium]